MSSGTSSRSAWFLDRCSISFTLLLIILIFVSPVAVRAQDAAPPPTQQDQSPQQAQPQQPSPPLTVPTIKAESRIVRVDVIVTDKKGNYVHDLSPNDFRG